MVKGVGVHCFAGGFTMGMREVLPVVGQLEIHDFGGQTCEATGTKFMNADRWQDWAAYKSNWENAQFCFGNPRCTAFSSYSSGAGKDVRGPRAKCCQDIWDVCRFGIHAGFELIAFESVQQAYSVGKQLLNMLRDELFEPNHYRIAHLFVNTAAEGNAQKRRRYFFVAYKDNKNFNVCIPRIPKYCTTVGDVLSKFQNRKVYEGKLYGQQNINYTSGTYVNLTFDEKTIIPYLTDGMDFNQFARVFPNKLKYINTKYYKLWKNNTSNIPFSLHCPTRMRWNGHCPTISSTSARLIHPREDRPLTVGEIAAMMGWPEEFIPVGPDPIGQIGKGVVPATGQWLGEQIKMYFENAWGNYDFESTWNNKTKTLHGYDYTKQVTKPSEKVFNLTSYIPPLKEIS